MDYLELRYCRLCGGEFSSNELALKSTPPANEIYPDADSARNCSKFPLVLVICKSCKHVQLKDIVSPDRLFSNYVYKSGTSAIFREHFRNLANLIAGEVPNKSVVLEIGSNDGKLLEFLNDVNLVPVGLEPSDLLVKESVSRGLTVYKGFLDSEFVDLFLSNHGPAKVVVANNVFAHIDDMQKAVRDISSMLASDGTFIFEVAHLLSLVRNGYFDTIYHEHMSYHSIFSLQEFLTRFGFGIYRVQKISTHGGSVRVSAKKLPFTSPYENEISAFVNEEVEAGINSDKVLELISAKIKALRDTTSEFFNSLTGNEFIFGYGAPAKVVTFLAEMELEKLNISGIVDDNPDKQNMYLPGSGFAIKDLDSIKSQISRADGKVICLIFPWNLGAELLEKLSQFIPPGSRAVSFFPQLTIKEF